MNPGSASYWYPRIMGQLGFPSPRTVIVPMDFNALARSAAPQPEPPPPLTDILKACDDIGYPVFIRSDLASAKLLGPNAYRADKPEDVQRAVLGTAAAWLGLATKSPAPEAILVREWLDLDTAFTAFNGHKIAREWRVFATPNRHLCTHFYWPHEAVQPGSPDRTDWADALWAVRAEPPPDAALNTSAVTVARLCREAPAWAVDFARDTKGAWWVIDAEPAAGASHFGFCPNSLPPVPRDGGSS